MGQTRATRYALARPVGREGSSWPLHRINEVGRAEFLGTLQALHRDAWHFEAVSPHPAWMEGEFRFGLFPDLPWFLDDLRPQGYLGRSFVHLHAEELDAPPDLNVWHSDHVLTALLRHGENLPGNLVVGEFALTQALRDINQPQDVVSLAERAREFPRRADAALQGRPIGPSAGGEHPKLPALLQEDSGDFGAVIVKFSEPAATSASAQRWTDLLQCEHLAGHALQAAGIAAAQTHVLDAGGRRFLQSTRFDRTPVLGRRGHVSLRALDAAYFGVGRRPWLEMADVLLGQGWLTPRNAETLRVIGLFGEMIGNSDMHFGNLAFDLQDEKPFGLVPIYDMLPMLYAPTASGAIVERNLDPPMPLPRYQAAWRRAAQAAHAFWTSVESDTWVSAPFRAIAGGNAGKIAGVLARFG